VDANCSLGVSGCRRLSPAICGEIRTEVVGGQVLSLVTGLPPLVCKSIARASKLRILPSGDAYITDLVLDIAATASHTSVRPSKTAQRHPSARRRGPLPTAGCHSLRPARPSAGLQPRTLTQLTLHGRRVINVGAGSLESVVAERLARNGVPTIDIVDPDVVEAVHLTRSSATASTSQGPRPFHGICVSGVRPTTRCA
jgi:hypothetical protein